MKELDQNEEEDEMHSLDLTNLEIDDGKPQNMCLKFKVFWR